MNIYVVFLIRKFGFVFSDRKRPTLPYYVFVKELILFLPIFTLALFFIFYSKSSSIWKAQKTIGTASTGG